MTDYRTELQRLVQAYDEHGGKWHDEDVQALHRAALAQPAPPAEGEVAELAVFLRDAAFDLNGSDPAKSMLTRAADLLEQRYPAPVPVSERPWERDGWSDEEGRCWWGRAADEFCNHDWHYATRAEVEEYCSDAMPQITLPAHALPAPSGEVE